MSPKEKANELVDKYYNYVNCWDDNGEADYKQAELYAKQCALIAVDEILDYSKRHGFVGLTEYMEEVKEEINKLK